MSSRVILVAALLVGPGLFARGAAAQAGAPLGVWLSAGVGGGGSSTADGLALSGAITLQKAAHQFTARALGMIVSAESGGEIPTELSLLYGRAHSGRWHHAAVSAGLGIVGDSRCDSTGYQCDSVFRPGLPLAAEVTLRLLPVAGLGLQAFGNLNPVASTAGLLITVQIGWLR